MQDPFYRQIIEGLNGRLDPDEFELCAGDLLRDAFPTLVPVRGGADFGMDGAVADGNGTAYPLVCTTSSDVAGNLRTSLTSYVNGRGTRRRAVVATSQELTQTKRRNLNTIAGEFGFELVQVVTQAAIALRLYRDSAWCLRLLGLTGRPCALSTIPETTRPLLGDAAIGRDDDIQWLRDRTADSLLVGQPGSGKTFLLYLLAREGWGLFVVDDNPDALANAIRDQKPTVVVVDDAHARPELLARLRQLRVELDASYRIVASSWPGEKDAVAQALNLATGDTRELERLTRDQVVEVVHAAGIRRPTRLVREIVTQAEGRPGLALTLSHLCLRGDVLDVAFGEALKRSLGTAFENLVGRRAQEILAACSISGDSGMALTDVAFGLGLPVVDVRDAVLKLAAGGVVLEVGKYLSVRPEVLRYLLIRDVFFAGATSLPLEPLLDRTSSVFETAKTLVGVRGFGGSVPEALLRTMLERVESDEAWVTYASLGRAETEYLLAHKPDAALSDARELLPVAPALVLPHLFKASIDEGGEYVERPLRTIEDWITARTDVAGDPVVRRTALLASTATWLNAGGDREVGLHGLSFVLLPNHEHTESDPGSGNTGTFSRGLLGLDVLAQIAALWPRVRDLIGAHVQDQWDHVLGIVEAWAYPDRHMLGHDVPAEHQSMMTATARTIVLDLATLAQSRPGIIHRLQKFADDLGTALPISLAADFLTLYPRRGSDDWRTPQRHVEQVQLLAQSWSRDEPAEVVKRLVEYDLAGRQAGLGWRSGSALACRTLASLATSRLEWFRLLRQEAAHPDLLEPFLRAAARNEELGWKDAVRECLRVPETRWIGVVEAIAQEADGELVAEGIRNTDGFAQSVAMECQFRRVPVETVGKLLRHTPDIATAAAIGEWQMEPEGIVRPELLADWKAAIVRSPADNMDVAHILEHDPLVAEEWLTRRFTTGVDEIPTTSELAKITGSLDITSRRRLLAAVPSTRRMDRLAKRLVGDDVELYREVLRDPRLERFHLVPLWGMDSSNWTELALTALDAGQPPEAIVRAAYEGPEAWNGPTSLHWQDWMDRFQLLTTHPDSRLRQVAARGVEIAEASREAARAQERNEQVFGTG
jgi:hypothetical protein